MNTLRALGRALRACLHVLRALWIIRTEYARLTPAQTQLLLREWTRQMLRILHVELVVQGSPPDRGPLLQLANHMSWLDILVMNAAHPTRFVSKADARHWPLLGTLVTAAGTLYIERESRRDAMRVVHHMAEALRDGDIVAVFPEGTTSDGRGVLPFHANLLQAAIVSCTPVIPAALRFADAATGETSVAPLYVGDDSLIGSLWRTLTAPPLLAVVRFGESQSPEGRDRRAWAQSLHADVVALRDLMR